MEEISRHVLAKTRKTDDLFTDRIFKYYDVLCVRVKGEEIFFKSRGIARNKPIHKERHFLPEIRATDMEMPHSQDYMRKLCEQNKGCRVILEDLQKKGYTVHKD